MNPDQRKRYLLDGDPKEAKKLDANGDDVVRRYSYLVSLTPLFRHFIDTLKVKDAGLRRQIAELNKKPSKTRNRSGGGGRTRKTEKQEDAELLYEEDHEPNATVLTESPSYIEGGTLREYQIQGLNWLISLYENRLLGILADEMGLGKTLQTISFLGFLRHHKGINGPFIVIVPKLTLDNWRREFAKWTPDVDICVLQGNKEERAEIISKRLMKAKFDVLITSFEMVIREKACLKKFRWQYIVVDEAHRIKNEDLSLSQIIRLFYLKNRLLITGTPLQNNLHELWALLNFLLPDVFGDSEQFDAWFQENEGDQDNVVNQLHQLLLPFLLRRVKLDVEKLLLPKKESNVYIDMVPMQLDWYSKLLEKDIDAVNGAVGKREAKTRLLNIVMQLRKCCNHPYLFDGAEPGPPYTTDEHLVYNLGKMIILDKMLKKFQKEGLRVLIFSQMSRLLDILEDYCMFRKYEYCRIDGLTSHEDRIAAIDEYNAPNSKKFVFLLTTRAGGLGINLTTADIVILYDSDWNPQADLQAMDRAHRIGQQKQVYVYRFVTNKSAEEKVLEKAAQKLRLDQLVIQQGRTLNKVAKNSANQNAVNLKDALIGMIQHGAKEVFENKNRKKGEKSEMFDDDIDAILARGAERTKELNQKFNTLGLDDLKNISFDGGSNYEWDGKNFKKKDARSLTLQGGWINPLRRERKEQQYLVDNYYKDVLNSNGGDKLATIKLKQPKQINLQDHQFAPPELQALLDREQLAYKKEIGYKYLAFDFDSDDELEFEDDQQQDDDDDENLLTAGLTKEEKMAYWQRKVDEVVPLSEEELMLKQKLLDELFTTWSRRDFTNFIHALAKFGRANLNEIVRALSAKPEDEVRRYAATFWDRYKEIEGHEKYILQIEAQEKKAAKLENQLKLLKAKLEACNDPLENLTVQSVPSSSKRVYTKAEDRFLLVKVHEYGLFLESLNEKIKEDIMRLDLFKFDWYFLLRTPQEIGRRITTLLLALLREAEGPSKKRVKKEATSLRTGSTEPNGKRVTPETPGDRVPKKIKRNE